MSVFVKSSLVSDALKMLTISVIIATDMMSCRINESAWANDSSTIGW